MGSSLSLSHTLPSVRNGIDGQISSLVFLLLLPGYPVQKTWLPVKRRASSNDWPRKKRHADVKWRKKIGRSRLLWKLSTNSSIVTKTRKIKGGTRWTRLKPN